MAQCNTDFLSECRKFAGSESRKATIKIKNSGFPIGINFECPFCHYSSKKNKETARINSKTLEFFCFACGERRTTE